LIADLVSTLRALLAIAGLRLLDWFELRGE
jgi:hypothetical protein